MLIEVTKFEPNLGLIGGVVEIYILVKDQVRGDGYGCK